MQPLRGEVWDVTFPIIGNHPSVVLTINPMISRLSYVTGTLGPSPTHIPLDRDGGLTRYDVSYANATDIHSIPQSRLRRRRARLHPAEMQRLESAVRTYLGL
jgi:mRNA interferase MazF